MYAIKEQFQNCTVKLSKPEKFGNTIILKSASQEQLEFLYKIDHIAVEKLETKKQKEPAE